MAKVLTESKFESIKHAVEFVDVQDQYSWHEDLRCHFVYNDYTAQEGDRVAIFKFGWSFEKDYLVFEWAPIGPAIQTSSVTFNRYYFPKERDNLEQMYQICYLTGENELLGASSPFQFTAEKPTVAHVSEESVYQSLSKSKLLINHPDNDEIKKLRDENAVLKQALKMVISMKEASTCKNYDAEIAELHKSLDAVQLQVNLQQKELNMLRGKIIESGEEYKKLFIEKYKVEKKYEQLLNKKGNSAKPLNTTNDFDLSILESLPPFPIHKSDK
ncbi:unnamed protein product [Phyllotreta striolata]|uniref:SKICH domain-containing protein n=1 Tax=Phyllotreta striolata TaxID=444603 RepID=A0A9N9TYU4_PHYSR|nr:unnamed protein product [Phyllotreta striolata]